MISLRQKQLKLVTLAGTLFAGILALWWLCNWDGKIAFLPSHAGAEWIIYPKPRDGGIQAAVPRSTVFTRELVLSKQTSKAELTLYAFKSPHLSINEQVVNLPANSNWKKPVKVDSTSFLRAGTNVLSVRVTNVFGPPALWLHLRTDDQDIRTDDNWEARYAGSATEKARLARLAPDLESSKQLFSCERPLDSLKRVWTTLCIWGGISFVLVLIVERMVARQGLSSWLKTDRATNLLLIGILVARAVLFAHNLSYLPPSMGFDAKPHEEYVQFIQEHGALPLPKDGWEMHQPPLYYTLGAMLVSGVSSSANETLGRNVLKGINGAAGLLQCWLVLLCLRRLFPGRPGLHAAGLLLAAFLPPQIYLAQYVTNEPLVWLLVTLAIYFTLRLLHGEGNSFWLHAGIGLALGAALLTKLTALPVIPIIMGLLIWRLWSQRDTPPSGRWRNFAILVVTCVGVCSWHYARVRLSGMSALPNWESDPSKTWWQEPGYHTSADLTRVGNAWTRPLFTSHYSFFDGMYTTLWGDGVSSGAGGLAFRPPWNYDLMNAGYFLALIPTVLLFIGLIKGVAKWLHEHGSLSWLLVNASFWGLLAGLIYMMLRNPWFAHVKAFYLLPGITPIIALAMLGWDLATRNRIIRVAIWTVLVLLVFTVCGTYWIRADNPETAVVHGLDLAGTEQKRAVTNLAYALDLDKNGSKKLLQITRAVAHFSMAMIQDDQNNPVEAVRNYQAALEVYQDFDGAANNLAWLLITTPRSDLQNPALAVQLAEKACKISREQMPIYVGTLATAYTATGRFDEAIKTGIRVREIGNAQQTPGLDPALLLTPETAARRSYAAFLERQGKTSEALDQLELAVQLMPNDAAINTEMANLLVHLGRNADAVKRYERSLEIEPNQMTVLNNLAWMLSTSPDDHVRNGKRAVELAERACELTENKVPVLLGTLAAAYAETGQFTTAVAKADQARDRARADGQEELAKKNEQFAELYRSGKAYRDSP